MLKTVFIRAGLLMLLTASVAAQTFPGDIQHALDADDYSLAITLVNKRLVDEPENEAFLYLKGSVIAQSGDIEKAIWYYQNLVDAVKDEVKPPLLIADIYRIQEMPDLYIEALKVITDAYPDDARAYDLLGDYYAMRAKRYFNSANKLGKTDMRQRKIQALSAATVETNDVSRPLKKSLSVIKQPTTLQRKAKAKLVPKQAMITKQQLADAPKLGIVDKPEQTREQVINFLRSWSQAWSSKVVKHYFEHYSSEYIPANNVAIHGWIEQKTDRIENKDFIDIQLTNIRIAIAEKNKVVARFDQRYASNRFNGESAKQLILKRHDDGDWLITSEQEL